MAVDRGPGHRAIRLLCAHRPRRGIVGALTTDTPNLAVTLNGTLNVTLINGFSPAVNDNFIVLTYASRSGTFSAIAGNGNTYSPLYNAGNLTLVAQ